MFLILGVSQGEKQLRYDQNVLCKCCGHYGRVAVWMRYTYFMLFFIPLFKWDKHYYVRMSCCASTCELNSELGRSVEIGETASLNLEDLNFYYYQTDKSPVHRCESCGFLTDEEFKFCPKCGKPL